MLEHTLTDNDVDTRRRTFRTPSVGGSRCKIDAMLSTYIDGRQSSLSTPAGALVQPMRLARFENT